MKKILSIFTFIAILTLTVSCSASESPFPSHKPYGEGVGVMPGRVVWSYEPDSVDWDGSGYWWALDNFNEGVILDMVNNSVRTLAGASSAAEGWQALFSNRNERNGEGGGYKSGEKIAIKANINGSAVMDDDTSGETKMSYTNPVLLKALLTSLVEEAGVAPSDITVYDVSRLFPDYMVEMCTEGILRGVKFVNRDNGVADEAAPIRWSHEFSGAVNYLPTCVTEAKYMINLANLKGHSYGITLCGKNHFGSFINGNTMRPPEGANLHQWLTKNEMGIYSPLVDLMANKHLGGKTVLYMLDAIICATSEGASITGDNSRWQQEPFGNDYTSSIFVSQDPVAIDSVGADFLTNEPTITENNYSARNAAVENYLHEAGLAANPPSGTVYTDSFGKTVTNLGVHEHWNNSTDKQYSRNLGKTEGIELVRADKTETTKPTIVIEGNKITVDNTVPNGTLILAFYSDKTLVGVNVCRGSDKLEADISTAPEGANAVKAFYLDMKNIEPLGSMIALPLPLPTPQGGDGEQKSKTLVAYFSWTNNTEDIANSIAEITGADTYEIIPKEPYGDENNNYYDQGTRAYKEQYDDAARPKISGTVENMAQYDTVFLGYPIWYGKAPKIIYTFLEGYDFSGKTIVPFCTSGSSDIGGSEADLHALANGASWLGGRRFSGGTPEDMVREWVDGLDLDFGNSENQKEGAEMGLTIAGTPVMVAWESNESVEALRTLCNDKPLKIQMSMYGGFEQVGSIGASLPRNDEQTTTQSGDIVLYSGNQIVIFYGSNSWSYTRLGRITDMSADDMRNLLGNGDVAITIE